MQQGEGVHDGRLLVAVDSQKTYSPLCRGPALHKARSTRLTSRNDNCVNHGGYQ